MAAPHEQGEVIASRRGFFWVGVDERIETPVGHTNRGAMYVEWEAPETVTQPVPIILVHGGGGQGTDYLGTPDGRPGWWPQLVQDGWAVYAVDRPGHGRAPLHPDVLGPMGPPFSYEFASGLFAGGTTGPMAYPPGIEAHTQWPGSPGSGRRARPVHGRHRPDARRHARGTSPRAGPPRAAARHDRPRRAAQPLRRWPRRLARGRGAPGQDRRARADRGPGPAVPEQPGHGRLPRVRADRPPARVRPAGRRSGRAAGRHAAQAREPLEVPDPHDDLGVLDLHPDRPAHVRVREGVRLRHRVHHAPARRASAATGTG